MWRRRRGGSPRPAAVVGAALALAVAVTGAAPASPARADTAPPTWAQVQAAKNDAAAAQQDLTLIQAAVVRLATADAAAASAELSAAYASTVAQEHLQDAQSTVAALRGQLVTARQDADQARERFAVTAIQIDRLGGNDLTLRVLGSDGGSGNLLDELSALDQLARSSADLETIARQKQHVVSSLGAAASAAERVRAAAQADAATKLEAARSAQATAAAELASGQQQQTDLAAKAAALGGQAQALQASYTAAQQALAAKGGELSSLDLSGVVVDPAAAKAYAHGQLAAHGWGSDQYGCLVQLWTLESGWRANAYNRSSGSYGIPQALPASKMQTAGADWLTNADTQIDWGLSYIARSYGSPCAAWAFEMSHTPHWY